MTELQKMRELVADLADAAITLLDRIDALDGEPDDEDDGNAEPWLGWTLGMAPANTMDLEDGGDTEPNGDEQDYSDEGGVMLWFGGSD